MNSSGEIMTLFLSNMHCFVGFKSIFRKPYKSIPHWDFIFKNNDVPMKNWVYLNVHESESLLDGGFNFLLHN